MDGSQTDREERLWKAYRGGVKRRTSISKQPIGERGGGAGIRNVRGEAVAVPGNRCMPASERRRRKKGGVEYGPLTGGCRGRR